MAHRQSATMLISGVATLALIFGFLRMSTRSHTKGFTPVSNNSTGQSSLLVALTSDRRIHVQEKTGVIDEEVFAQRNRQLSNLDALESECLNFEDLILRQKGPEICEKYPTEARKAAEGDSGQFDTDFRIIRDVKHKYSICLTPKAGSTFLLSYVIRVANDHNIAAPPPKNSRYVQYHSITSYWDKLRKGGWSFHDKTIAVVRNPWQRLVSVYLQKMPVSNKERLKFVFRCQGYIALADRYPNPRYNMTFEDFMTCAVNQMEDGYYNRHWEPVYKRCNLCADNYMYNYIVKQENLDDELDYIIGDRLHIKDSRRYRLLARNETIREVEQAHLSEGYVAFYRKLNNKSLISRFAMLHHIDMEMFGYPMTPFQ